MARDDLITYEELFVEHKQNMMKSRLNLRPISSALSKGPAAMVSGGEGFHLRVLLME
jgi:hypothetical protein